MIDENELLKSETEAKVLLTTTTAIMSKNLVLSLIHQIQLKTDYGFDMEWSLGFKKLPERESSFLC